MDGGRWWVRMGQSMRYVVAHHAPLLLVHVSMLVFPPPPKVWFASWLYFPSCVQGDFMMGRPHGFGRKSLLDGTLYLGSFENDQYVCVKECLLFICGCF